MGVDHAGGGGGGLDGDMPQNIWGGDGPYYNPTNISWLNVILYKKELRF